MTSIFELFNTVYRPILWLDVFVSPSIFSNDGARSTMAAQPSNCVFSTVSNLGMLRQIVETIASKERVVASHVGSSYIVKESWELEGLSFFVFRSLYLNVINLCEQFLFSSFVSLKFQELVFLLHQRTEPFSSFVTCKLSTLESIMWSKAELPFRLCLGVLLRSLRISLWVITELLEESIASILRKRGCAQLFRLPSRWDGLGVSLVRISNAGISLLIVGIDVLMYTLCRIHINRSRALPERFRSKRKKMKKVSLPYWSVSIGSNKGIGTFKSRWWFLSQNYEIQSLNSNPERRCRENPLAYLFALSVAHCSQSKLLTVLKGIMDRGRKAMPVQNKACMERHVQRCQERHKQKVRLESWLNSWDMYIHWANRSISEILLLIT